MPRGQIRILAAIGAAAAVFWITVAVWFQPQADAIRSALEPELPEVPEADLRYSEKIERERLLLGLPKHAEFEREDLGPLTRIISDPATGDEERAVALRWRANFLLSRREYEKALADINESKRLLPDDFVTHRLESVVLRRHGDCKAALAAADRAVELAPESYQMFETRGDAQKCAGDEKAAIADYKKAIAILEDLRQPPTVTGDIFDWLFGIDWNSTINRRIGWMQMNLCRLHWEAERYGAAHRACRQSALNNDNPSSWHWAGRSLLKLDDPARAAEAFDRAIASAEEYGSADADDHFYRGYAYDQAGDPARAIADYETARAKRLRSPARRRWTQNRLAELKGGPATTPEAGTPSAR